MSRRFQEEEKERRLGQLKQKVSSKLEISCISLLPFAVL